MYSYLKKPTNKIDKFVINVYSAENPTLSTTKKLCEMRLLPKNIQILVGDVTKLFISRATLCFGFAIHHGQKYIT